MDQKRVTSTGLNRRDVQGLLGGPLVILAALCVFGRLDVGAAIVAGGLVVGFGYLYLRQLRGNVSEVHMPVAARGEGADEQSAANARRAMVEALSQPALIIGGQEVQAFNAAAGQLFNLVGTIPSVANLRHPDLLAGLAQVQATGGAFECEIVPARFPGQHWQARLTALKSGLPVSEVLLVLTDQAPVRQAERARADFLANASHELRTPLTAISGFVETMQGAAKDDKGAWPRFIDIIAEQASHMRGLITDLLSLSRIELGEHEVLDTSIDFTQILKESVEAMGHIAKARNLSLDLAFEQTGPGAGQGLRLIGAESEVKQVVQNLVSNAMKYSEQGGVVKLKAGRCSVEDIPQQSRPWPEASGVTLLSSPAVTDGTEVIWLSVRDTGAGIEAEFLPRLGERFFRVDASRGGAVEGTGLGLAIVKHIMAHHQGGFAVESLPGEGALFTVWFKAVREETP